MLGLAALAAMALLPGLLRLSTDNSPHIFFVAGSERVAEYRRFLDLFGNDQAVRMVLEGPALWTAEGLSVLRRLEEGAASVPGVTAVSGLYGHATGGRRGAEWPPADPDAFRRRMASDPLAHDLGWVGNEGEVLTVLASLTEASSREQAEVLARLEEIERRALEGAPSGLTARLAGGPVLDRALDRSTDDIERRYLPWLVGLTVMLLWLSFRNVWAVLVPLGFVALTELTTLGSMGWTGVQLNLVLGVLPPLLFVIALATAVHVLVRCRDLDEEGTVAGSPPSKPASETVTRTYRDKGWAVLWTGVSTLVGFTSLAVSPVGPVRTLGIWAGFGIAAMTLFAFLVYPAFLSLTVGRSRSQASRSRRFERWFQRAGRRWAEWAARHRRWVLAAAAATALAALSGVPYLEIETNALHYLAPEHPARAGIEELEGRGIGTSTVELMLRLPADETDETSDGFESLAGFQRLAELSEALRHEPGVLGAVSAGDLLEDAVRRAPGGALFGASTARRVAFDRLTGRERPQALDRSMAEEGRAARVSLFTRTAGTEEIDPLIDHVLGIARERFPEAKVTATGTLVLVLESQRYLLSTLGLSLALTFGVIAVIFRALLPSTRLTLLALLPNLWPVVGVVGLMGWTGIPLDVATVMVASVVLGLAVDDTIHTLGHFRELAPERGRFEAVAGTLERTAPSYVLTGLILSAGFGVCALSDFAPTARFGALSAFAIALAVLGDLVLLPALLGSTPHSVVARLERKRRS